MKKLSRMESSKEARRILSRHGVDLAYCQYSCCGSEIKLTGWLCKHDGSDFNGPQIQALLSDFQRFLPGSCVSGDLDNWHFTSESISFLGDKDGHGNSGNGGDGEQVTYEIDDDYDSDAS